MFKLEINPVDLSKEVCLPEPWPVLEENKFHEDLIKRAKGFYIQATSLGYKEEASEFLRFIGGGFIKPFNSEEIQIPANDPDRDMKIKALAVLQSLSNEFGDRVSSIVWKTYAFLATRPNPTGYATILESKDYLPFPWYIADTVLHGTGKVYGFMLHVHSKVFRETGLVFEHNCDCGCDVHGGDNDEDFSVHAPLKAERKGLATAALFSHLVSESLLIMALKMPFNMGVSPEAAEVMNLNFET